MNNLFKIFISFVMMGSGVHVYGADSKPLAPTCQLEIDSTDNQGNPIRIPNGTCQSAWSIYNTQMAYWNQAEANGKNLNYTGLTEPVKPTSPNCAAGDNNCLSINQSALADYNAKKDLYDRQKQQMDQAAAQAADTAKAAAAADAMASASGGYGNVADQNNSGSAIYQAAAMAAGSYGASKVAEAAGCSGTCSTAAMIAAQVAFGIMGAAASQSNRMDVAAYSACNSANQTGASQTSCGAPPTVDLGNVYDPSNSNNPISGIGSDGKCKPDAPPSCNAFVNGPGKNLNLTAVSKGVSAFAADNNKAKIAADGTVTLPDGTKTTIGDLMTKEGMMKAGLTAAQADNLLKQMGAGATAAIDIKKDLKEINKPEINLGDSGGAGAAGAATASQNLNGNKTGLKDIDKRKPSSEGLTRNFNGEAIGASGDDIFSMMNRRYKLKSAQDTFMGPK